ncbi:MAG: lectin like domain-containing protein [Oscillospiraceae bacterium]|nr:lectin like domain-containing protein [Oscillospiraceae bacterium]
MGNKKSAPFAVIISLLFTVFLIILPADEIYSESSFPQKFDLRDYNLVSDIRSQGNYGTCWSFSALGSLETQILKIENKIDLSEWHLAFFSYNNNKCNDAFRPKNKDDIFNEGGYNNIAAATLTKWIGPVTEDIVPYDSGYPSEDKKFSCSYQVQDIYNITPWISQRRRYSDETMKELIYDKNALSCSFSADTEHFCNLSTSSFYCPDPGYFYMTDPDSHSILLIGWDDNYSKENFREDLQPEHDGAWLCKNSWGDSGGLSGYIWISYEDCSLIEAAAYFCEPAGTYLHNYYYDNYGWSTSLSTDLINPTPGNSTPRLLTGYMSNVFAASQDELVSAVSFYTIEPDASYEISVFTQIDPHAAPDEQMKYSSYPVSGTSHPVTSGSEKYSGYHTVKLNQPVRIHENETFSVTVKITNQSSPYVIPIDASIAMTINNSIKTLGNVKDNDIASFSYPNQSFVSADGIQWYDLYKHNLINFNFISSVAPDPIQNVYCVRINCGHACVKAFTRPYTPLLCDVDDNSTVNAADLALIKHKLLSSDVPTDNEMIFYDLNNDGEYNVKDFVFIVMLLLNSD